LNLDLINLDLISLRRTALKTQNANKLGVAIIGCGLIGKKRVLNLNPDQVLVTCDLTLKRAEDLAKGLPNCKATASAETAIMTPGVEVVFIATLNSSLAPLAMMAVEAGKHVLVEKPGAISVEEMKRLKSLADQKKVMVRVGFNHRYHPAFQKAYEIFNSGALGKMMFIRARYGHGGRVGYEKEWRADAKLSGGGELMDQGVHLIDLAGSFLGNFTSIDGHAATYFWQMKVDDNAFLNLRNSDGQTAWLQVSCTEWKNLFSFEVYGANAKLHIEGLGGSYGIERLSYYQMLPEMGPPETTVFEYPRGDQSWKIEMDEFFEDIALHRQPVPGPIEAMRSLEVVEKIYKKSGYPTF
jgi:predicted dehydrogenase